MIITYFFQRLKKIRICRASSIYFDFKVCCVLPESSEYWLIFMKFYIGYEELKITLLFSEVYLLEANIISAIRNF